MTDEIKQKYSDYIESLKTCPLCGCEAGVFNIVKESYALDDLESGGTHTSFVASYKYTIMYRCRFEQTVHITGRCLTGL